MLDAMPPLHDAGSRPAMRTLAPMWEIDTHPALELPVRPAAPSLEWLRCAVSSSIFYAAASTDRAPPPPASRSNRHRARCTVGAPSPATSCIAGFADAGRPWVWLRPSRPPSANLYKTGSSTGLQRSSLYPPKADVPSRSPRGPKSAINCLGFFRACVAPNVNLEQIELRSIPAR
jgi:hypothetical protein